MLSILSGDLTTSSDRDNFVLIVNKIIESGNSNITFVNRPSSGVNNKTFEKQKKIFLRRLNKHSLTKSNIKDSQESLKTRVFANIYRITRAAQNQLKAQITVDTCTGELKSTAGKTTGGNAEKLITPYNPASKFVMQVQNMLGKAVVGIGAVSLKTYFILSTSYNKTCNNIVKELRKPLIDAKVITSLIRTLGIERINIQGERELATLANINLDKVIRELKRHPEIANMPYEEGAQSFTLLEALMEMKRNTSKISTPEFLSGIISLAADNAKDLALPKLNATEDLVDIYTTAAMIGIPFKDVASVMTDKMFGWMTQAGAQNIFDDFTEGNKVKNMVEFALLSKINKRLIKSILGRYNNWIRYSKKHYKMASYSDEDKIRQSLSDIDIINGVIAMFEDNKVYKDDDGKDFGNIITITAEYESQSDAEQRMAQTDENGRTPPPPLVKADYYEGYRLFQLYKGRVENLGDINKLYFLKNLLIAVEEMSTLGRQASINQGLKTDIRGFYNSMRTIEDLINKRLASIENEDGKTLFEITEGFEFRKFLTDEQYCQKWVEFFDNPEYGLQYFNILRALSDSPNFFAMSKIQPIAETMLRTTLSTYRAAESVADSVTISLSENDFKALFDYITDLSIFNFLSDSNNGIEIDLNKVVEDTGADVLLYEVKGIPNRSSRKTLKLDSLENIASLKHIIEENIIPTLKEKFNKNRFITALSRRDNPNINAEVFALPIQMMDIDSDEGMIGQYAGYLEDFNNIAREKIAGLTVGDWIFLYNLIVNKNGFGQQSLTRIFEDMVNSPNIPITMQAYYSSIGNDAPINSDNALAYIALKSRGTRITSVLASKINLSYLPEDFTLILPGISTLNNDILSEGANLVYTKTLGDIAPDVVLRGLADRINSLRSGTVKIITAEEANEMGEKANGFIRDGVIYLNSTNLIDSTTGVASAVSVALHEVAHLVCAAMKLNNDSKHRDRYYRLLDKVKFDEDFQRLAEPYMERGLVGSDLAEEVLCKKIEKLLENRINKSSDLEVAIAESGILFDSLGFLFPGISQDEALNGNLEYMIEHFTSDMFGLIGELKLDFIKNSQEMAMLKSQLYNSTDENNKLKQDCDPF